MIEAIYVYLNIWNGHPSIIEVRQQRMEFVACGQIVVEASRNKVNKEVWCTNEKGDILMGYVPKCYEYEISIGINCATEIPIRH